MAAMRDRLESKLSAGLPGMKINGDPKNRLPNTLSVSFPLVEANTLLDEIGDEVAASAGAACHTDSVEISTVLEAMGVPLETAMGTVRFSTGRSTSAADIDRAAEVVIDAVKKLGPSGDVSAAGSEDIRLTKYTHGLGCACKLRPQDLEKVLEMLPAPSDENVLIGKEKADDAAVYRITEEIAIVQTVDFFTPVVDDPRTFGAISAANSLSDIYAMGAQPLFGLNIVGFPSKRLPVDVLREILEGALEKADEAGISIIGGHTIEDTEPKYGLAVTGTVHPDRVIGNSGARPGDIILLTKPIGTGIIATAMKRGLAGEESARKAIEVMSSLNRDAAEAMRDFPVSACTDVTGFGLIGHLREMAAGSAADAEIWLDSVPVIEGVDELASLDAVPGGTVNNHAFTENVTSWDPAISRSEQMILCDAQTSGGLMIALPESEGVRLLDIMVKRGIEAAAVGRFTGAGEGRISVLKERK
jgi:selenium donor protein